MTLLVLDPQAVWMAIKPCYPCRRLLGGRGGEDPEKGIKSQDLPGILPKSSDELAGGNALSVGKENVA